MTSQAPAGMSSNSENNTTCLVWQDLSVVRHSLWGSTKKTIVRGVSGRVGTGQLVALLGPSGAGKSTLLNALRGSTQGATVHGEIYSTSPLRLCYIEQHAQENVESSLTVGQLLSYAFHFKNGTKQWKNQEKHIETILNELMLDGKILEQQFANCSGGEQRRVVLAQELMSLERKPQLLLLDEPSTGLDSSAALQLVTCLAHLAQTSQMSILLSIHQPSDTILSHFHHIYILARGGVTIYAGRSTDLRQHLRTQLNRVVAEDKPPLEEYLEIGCNGLQSKNVRLLADSVREDVKCSVPSNLTLQKQGLATSKETFHIRHLMLAISRTMRTTFISNRRFVLTLVTILLLWYFALAYIFGSEMIQNRSCTFNSTSSATQCGLEIDKEAHHQAYTFYTLMALLFFDVSIMIHGEVLTQRFISVFRHEHRNGWYSLGTFYLSYSTVKLLETSFYSLLTTVTIYFSVSHHALDDYSVNPIRLAHFAGLHLLDAFYWNSQGQFFGALFPYSKHVVILLGQTMYITIAFSNGQAVITESLGNEFLNLFARINGIGYITKGLFYTVYGLDGCNPDVIRRHYIQPSTVYTDLLKPLLVSFVLRFAIITILYLRYSLNIRRKFKPRIKHDWSEYESGENTGNNLTIDIGNKEIKNENGICYGKVMLAWSNLTLHASSPFYVFQKDGSKVVEKSILKNLHGHLRFGQVTALMGASGAGKTTLLKVLSGQCNDRLSPESRFYLNRIQAISTCYLTQEVSGHLWPGLTVRQSLVYSSQIKNASDEVLVDHNKTADYLILQLQLEDAQHTLVNKCSGGERKRVALAQELTTRIMPNLVCLDEPTSGLDSSSALLVMSCMRRIAIQHQVSVVISVHQPSQDMLEHMDRLYCLSRGGLLIYHGTTDEISSHLPQSSSPSPYPLEHLIHHSCQGEQSDAVVKLSQQAKIKEIDEMSTEISDMCIGKVLPNRIRFRMASALALGRRYCVYVIGHLWLQWLVYLICYIGFALFMRFFFDARIAGARGCVRLEENWDESTCYREEEMTQLTINFRYLAILLISFLYVVSIQSVFWLSDELVYLRNERRNGWYTTGVFYLTKSVEEAVHTVILVCIFIYIVDIWSAYLPGIYLWIILPMLIASSAMQTLGHIATMVGGKEQLIQCLLAIAFFLLETAFTNFLNSSKTERKLLKTLRNFSSTRMVEEAILSLLYGFGRCSDRQIPAVLHQAGIQNPESHYYHCLRMLAIHLIVLRIVACLILSRKFGNLQAGNGNKNLNSLSNTWRNKEEQSLGIGLIPAQFKVRCIQS